MSHPFGDLLSQHLHRKHGLSQSKLAAGILQAPTIITGMCKGRRLTGPQARERVVAIIGWLEQQSALNALVEANALLNAAGMAPLQRHEPVEAALLRLLHSPPAQRENTGADDSRDFNATIDDRQATLPTHQSANHNLPAQLTPFVGRTTEMADLADLLTNPDVRLVTLLGPGGIGKTRLAQTVALQQVAHFRHGVYFIALAGVDSAYAILPLIADVLNFAFYAGGTPLQQLGDYLRHKSILLVLDNFEHFIDSVFDPAMRSDACSPDELNGVTLLLDLLHAAPQLNLLITSRVRLNVQGEQLYAIEGIDFPDADPITLTAARQTSAVELFVQSARRVQANFTLTADNVTAVGHICRLVQGMPLAILLAAAWVELLAPSEILAELSEGDKSHQNLDFLTTELQNVPTRQRSLRAVFDYSWRLLSPPEQTLFAQLSIFRGGFTRAAAQAVTGATHHALIKLVNKSLVRRQATGRYDLHELVRQYAADRLTQMPALGEAARTQQGIFYCALLGEQAATLQGAAQGAALTQIELELDNVHIAWQWAVEHEQIEPLAQAMPSLGLCYQWRSRYQAGEAAYGKAIHKLRSMKNQSPAAQQVLAQALAWQSVFLRQAWRMEEASHLLQQSLAVLDRITPDALDARPARAFTLLQIGRLSTAQADLVTGQQHYQQALTLYQALDDRWGEAHVLAGLGEINRRSGNFQVSCQLYEASLALYRTLNDDRGSAHVLTWLGFALREQAQFVEAEQMTRESIALYTRLGDRARIATGQFALGWAYIYAGRFAEAYPLVEKSMAIEEELGLPTSLSTLGLINVELGNYRLAHRQLQRQVTRNRTLGDKEDLSLCLDVLSCLAVVEGRYADAQQLLAEDAALHQELGEQHRLAHAYAWLGYTARGLGRRAEAAHHFCRALQLTVINQSFSALLFILPGIALLFADQGESERAIETYAWIADLPIVANSQMRWDLAGAHLATVAATLPPQVATAASAQGKAGNLWAMAATLLVELGHRGWSA
ncbi:MAG: tetratricopeptide repeat protein [Chloroflexota bacterium]|nr:tetratricopeptide repeat protein [Chloroflexota bacterium]